MQASFQQMPRVILLLIFMMVFYILWYVLKKSNSFVMCSHCLFRLIGYILSLTSQDAMFNHIVNYVKCQALTFGSCQRPRDTYYPAVVWWSQILIFHSQGIALGLLYLINPNTADAINIICLKFGFRSPFGSTQKVPGT